MDAVSGGLMDGGVVVVVVGGDKTWGNCGKISGDFTNFKFHR